MTSGLSTTTFVALAAALAVTLPVAATGTNDQVNAKLDYGTFQDPSAIVRPKWRYWLPDASVNQSAVASDIKGAVAGGAGGVEFLGYYLYGGINSYGLGGLAESNWSIYGWGTSAWSMCETSTPPVVTNVVQRMFRTQRCKPQWRQEG